MWVIHLDLFKAFKNLQSVEDLEETKSFYYTFHDCPQKGEHSKVMFDYTLSVETGDEILKIGVCPDCGKGFYHRDFQTKNF